jgi:hypothetical protein
MGRKRSGSSGHSSIKQLEKMKSALTVEGQKDNGFIFRIAE